MATWIEKATKGKVSYNFGEQIKPYSKKKSYLLCPECGTPLKTQCLCPRQDSICNNGHKWHIEFREGKRFVEKGEGLHPITIEDLRKGKLIKKK